MNEADTTDVRRTMTNLHRLVPSIVQGFNAANLAELGRGRGREHRLVGRIADRVRTAVLHDDPEAEVRRSRSDAVIGPDDRRWEVDFVVRDGDRRAIAVEVKELTGSGRNLKNDHAELARGLGQCLVFKNRIAWSGEIEWRFDGAMMLVVMPEGGVGLVGTGFGYPLAVEDHDGRFWIYGVARRLLTVQ